MKFINSLLCILVLVLSIGCVRSIKDVRNGRVVAESTAVSAPGYASLTTRENDQPYDDCLARAGSLPNRGLVVETCMDNAMRVLVRDQCPQFLGMYQPYFWRRNASYLECLNQVGWMPDGRDEAICIKQIMIQQSTSLCAMLAPTGMPYGYGPVTVIN